MTLKALFEGEFLNGECMTVTGKTIKENLKNVNIDYKNKYNLLYKNPISPTGVLLV